MPEAPLQPPAPRKPTPPMEFGGYKGVLPDQVKGPNDSGITTGTEGLGMSGRLEKIAESLDTNLAALRVKASEFGEGFRDQLDEFGTGLSETARFIVETGSSAGERIAKANDIIATPLNRKVVEGILWIGKKLKPDGRMAELYAEMKGAPPQVDYVVAQTKAMPSENRKQLAGENSRKFLADPFGVSQKAGELFYEIQNRIRQSRQRKLDAQATKNLFK